MNKLIEIANSVKTYGSKPYTKDEIELALSWIKGEVSSKGVCKALNIAQGNHYPFIAGVIKRLVIENKVNIIKL
jgi:hypothetical protein